MAKMKMEVGNYNNFKSYNKCFFLITQIDSLATRTYIYISMCVYIYIFTRYTGVLQVTDNNILIY